MNDDQRSYFLCVVSSPVGERLQCTLARDTVRFSHSEGVIGFNDNLMFYFEHVPSPSLHVSCADLRVLCALFSLFVGGC